MSRRKILVTVSAAFAVAAGFSASAQEPDRGPADRFVAALNASPAIPAEAVELIQTRWAQCLDCDPEEFLTQGLTLVSAEFRKGLDAYDADEYAACADRMAKLGGDADPFVAVNAAAYEIKSLIALDQTLEAGKRIARLLDDNGGRLATYSYFSAEIDFLRGYCLLADLQYESAAEALAQFLSDYSNAPQRLLIPARQILLELANREPGRIGEVVDLMQFSNRRLKNADSGEIVQTRQQRILDILDTLIAEAEERERNACSAGAGGSGGGRNQSQSQSPSNPMQDSVLPGGGFSEGELRAARRANPGEMWGAMPPTERERILQALRESFPNRYRQLVEQYYEELAKKP